MRLQEMFLQGNFPRELQLTLRAGIVVVSLEVSQQRALPLEGTLAELATGDGLGPGAGTTDGFFLMFFVDVITQTVRVVEP